MKVACKKSDIIIMSIIILVSSADLTVLHVLVLKYIFLISSFFAVRFLYNNSIKLGDLQKLSNKPLPTFPLQGYSITVNVITDLC